MSDLTVRAVLDATAIVAYARGSVAVGEILAEIADERAGFGVPDLCLIEGARQLDVDEWPALDLLVAHSQCVRLALPADWRDVASAARLLGSTSRGVAMLAAVDLRSYLLTAEPGAYGDDASLVIAI